MTDPLAQLLVIWIGVFIAVYAAKATKLTPVLFYMAVGAVGVNTGILPHEAHPFIRGFAEIGIIVIMFALGFEESPVKFPAQRQAQLGDRFLWRAGPIRGGLFRRRLFLGRHQYVDDVRAGDDRHGGIADHGVAEGRRPGPLGRGNRHHDFGGAG